MSQQDKEKARKKALRNKLKDDGALDGRFTTKEHKDNKRDEDKYICREKIDPSEYQEKDDFSDIDLFDYMEDDDLSDEEIKDLVDEYNAKEDPAVPLHQYLGMTEEQFQKWEEEND